MTTNANLTEQEHACTATRNYDPKNVHYEGDTAIYTDPTTKCQFQWEADRNEWLIRTKYECGFEDDTHTFVDADGTKYFWDKEKNAWFPKLGDDFMAQYQLNYGFSSTDMPPRPAEESPKPAAAKQQQQQQQLQPQLPTKGMKRKAAEPSWFHMDDSRNTKVYVSNLPLNITEEKFAELMQKYGIVMRDPNTNQLKIKLYRDAMTNDIKGDALCTYIRRESVELALKLLDGLDYDGSILKVEIAKFQMKGDYDPKLKPKTKKRKDKEKEKRQQDRLFDWRPEKKIGDRGKHERCVVLKNVFDSKEFDDDVSLILTIQDELRTLCGKCGDVRKVIVYDRHPEGVVQVNMRNPDEAVTVVNSLHQTYYRKRLIMADVWDGRTKFRIAETDAQISNRLDNWDKFLEANDESTKSDVNGGD